MNTLKRQLMERAGLVIEAELNFLPQKDVTHSIVFKDPMDAYKKLVKADIDINFNNVGFVFPKMTRETWLTIKSLFRADEVGDIGQFNANSVSETYDIKEASTDALNATKRAISKINQSDETNNLAVKTGGNTLEAIRNGYYALADNLPDLINSIQKAIKLHAKVNPKDVQEMKALQNELKIYNDIRTLLDESTFGAIL